MSAKTVFPAALVLTLLHFCAAHAQLPTPQHIETAPAPTSALPPDGALPNGAPPPNGAPIGAPAGLSSWITGTRANCCGPVGGDGPICSEIFFRTGPSFNLGQTSILNNVIHTGWMIEGGYRSLFFTPERLNAWTIEFGVSNIVNQGKFNNIGGIPLTVLVPGPTGPNGQATGVPIAFGKDVPGVTIRSLNRTAANLGGGHEWYFNEPSCNGVTWRAGFDVGGRWGSENALLNELRHRSKVFEGVWVAIHSDVEVPLGCCSLIAGLRLEWDYTWSELLQANTDLSGINLLMNFGVRY
jgi:hypothetical protein